MKYEAAFLRDVFDWDVRNWQKALKLWSTELEHAKGKTALAIGEKNGGLSLLLATHGAHVVCSDLHGPTEKARNVHAFHGVSGNVVYKNADILRLPFQNDSFDYVAFKSVLGVLQKKEKQEEGLREIHRVLRKGGTLLFAENLCGSSFHQWARKKFVRWAEYWRYLPFSEAGELFAIFPETRFTSAGVLGAFGRTEFQRNVLGHFDTVLEKSIPPEYHYILFGICKK